MRNGIILSGIVITGIFLRWVNLSPYKFYPDAYQTLLVARNIQTAGSVAGTLGEGGYFFPKYLMWTRPVYPLLVLAGSVIIRDPAAAARTLAFSLSAATIPLAYIFIYRVWSSRTAALAAAAITAWSFNHIVWSGFILPEAVGIFFLTVFLILLVSRTGQESRWAQPYDLLTGGLWALAVFCRYEYAATAAAVGYLIYKLNPKPWPKLVNISVGAVFTGAVILAMWFPLPQLASTLLSQYRKPLLFTAAAGIGIWAGRRYMLTAAAGGLLLLLMIYPGLRDFLRTDLLLTIAAGAGFWIMHRGKKPGVWMNFCLLGIVFLAPVYWLTNPNMPRYPTHLLPFLLIPAGLGVRHLSIRRNFRLAAVILIAVQLAAGYQGLRVWDAGWFASSYEEKAATLLGARLTGNPLLVVSLPEPYFYFTGLTVAGVRNEPPFVDLEHWPGETPVVIVDDMAMRDLFPRFSEAISEKFSHRLVFQSWVNEPYRYQDKKEDEIYPIKVYQTFVYEVKNSL